MIKVNCDLCDDVIEQVRNTVDNELEYPKIIIRQPNKLWETYEVCQKCVDEFKGGIRIEKTAYHK